MSVFPVLILFLAEITASTVIDPEFGYRAVLPAGWARTVDSDTHHVYQDTSMLHSALMAVRRHKYAGTVYADADDWIRMNFSAYLLTVRYNISPFGAVIYFDSNRTRQKSGHWAPEVWSLFFTVDSQPSFSEFLVYSEANGFGYEMYIIGDSSEVFPEIDFYADLIDSITFIDIKTEINYFGLESKWKARASGINGVEKYFDLRGRIYIVPTPLKTRKSAGTSGSYNRNTWFILPDPENR